MKIRFYKNIDGLRWIGFLVAMIGTFILSSADVETQWIGWAMGLVSCSIWVYFGWKDRDTPRTLMELMYLLLSMRAVYNWLVT
jgi:drug/metabolite transporter (DMT)-like permease